jgi:glycosyltransferase involved in cell wall biosynthesis
MHTSELAEILFISSYPPRECGIATYSHDLIMELNKKFNRSFRISVCALESDDEQHHYSKEVIYKLNTSAPETYEGMAETINQNDNIAMVVLQHEFGFFHQYEEDFRIFMASLNKPVVIAFHTVLPKPDSHFKMNVQNLVAAADSVIVMTTASSRILADDYEVPARKISVIPHGTHLVSHSDKNILKEKYELAGKKVLSTFGLLSSGKGIETTLNALPEIIKVRQLLPAASGVTRIPAADRYLFVYVEGSAPGR